MITIMIKTPVIDFEEFPLELIPSTFLNLRFLIFLKLDDINVLLLCVC